MPIQRFNFNRGNNAQPLLGDWVLISGALHEIFDMYEGYKVSLNTITTEGDALGSMINAAYKVARVAQGIKPKAFSTG